MRTLHKDQEQRIAALTTCFDEYIPAMWNTTAILARSGYQIRLKDDDITETYKFLVTKLEHSFCGETLAKALVDFYVFPSAHLPDQQNRLACLSDLVAQHVAQRWIVEHPSVYALEQIGERIRYMLTNVFENTEIPLARDSALSQPEHGYHFPQIKACIDTLTAFKNVKGINDFAEAFIWGEWNTDFEIEVRHCWDTPNVYAAYGYDVYKPLLTFCRWLDESGYFGYETYRAGALQFGNVFVQEYLLGHEEDDIEADTKDSHRDKMRIHTTRFAAELIAGFPERAGEFNRDFQYVHPQGGEWLLKGLDCIEKYSFGIKQLRNEEDELSEALRRLVNISGLAPDETLEDIILALQAFKEDTLLTALPYAGAARNILLKALAWDDIVPVQTQLFAIAGEHSATTDTSFKDIPNCDNPDSGVIDRYILEEALSKADSKRLARYLKLMKDAKLEIGNTLMFIEAVRGSNRAALEKKLVRHGQAAIKAYGLLSVADEDDVLNRYLCFKRLHKECTKYGAERQANTRAAIKAGLANLAQAAGFPDAVRLEWKMEAKIADDVATLNQRHRINPWELELVLEGITPKIVVYKDDKPLKSVPPAARKAAVYQSLKEQQALLKDQASRFRRSLETMMCRQETIAPDDLQTLVRLPVVKLLLGQLILQSTSGAIGLFDPDTLALVDTDGVSQPIDSEVFIVHPYHLYQARTLSAWQKAIVKQRIVQPFKQAFRELYILTPAEEKTDTFSNRFAGHALKSSVASRLLQTRGWQMLSSDVPEVYKAYRDAGILAHFDFPDARHYLSEMPEVVSDRIYFTGQQRCLSLKEIPPLIFSETMRDADLVVSVAQLADENAVWSKETYQRRAELIGALLENLGLANIKCEGHFAYIQGKRASYRVHLGSAVIHIESGNYLCVVPERKKEETIYLPFADSDRKMTEVISKILLLVNDDKIKDRTILDQIEAAMAMAMAMA